MSLPILMVTTVALATTALSATIPNESAEKPTETSVETFDSYAVQQLPQQLPLNIELPREESGVPFYAPEPDTYLRAPQYNTNPEPDFYQVPIPSEYLVAPTEGIWNPDNDPTLYYELPASITKENYPTNEYPKKFNQDIHSKSKPVSASPKKVIALEPISENQYIQKQKDLYKTLEKLNKKENQKEIELEKAQQAV